MDIGIIGGADGPTSVLVSKSTGILSVIISGIVLLAVIAAVSVIIILIRKHRK